MDDLGFLSSSEFGALVFHLLLVWPLWRVYRRVGLAPGWALLVIIPVFGLALALAPLALQRWPLAPAGPMFRKPGGRG